MQSPAGIGFPAHCPTCPTLFLILISIVLKRTGRGSLWGLGENWEDGRENTAENQSWPVFLMPNRSGARSGTSG
jgi:hypothetical protein